MRRRERPPVAEKIVGAPSVNETNLNTLGKILAFAAVVEVGTGLALLIAPAIVVALLLGAEVSAEGTLLGRGFGIALLALGLACWPGRQRAESGSPAFRVMLIYNVLIALYLAYLGTVWHLGGVLVVAGRCAARRRGAVAGLDVARRATDQGDSQEGAPGVIGGTFTVRVPVSLR